LADKYAIPDLRQRALACLSKAWPSTLVDYDARIARRREQKTLRGTSKFPHNKSFHVILAGRKTGAFHLLPSAHHLLCQRYMENLDEAFGPEPTAASTVLPPDEFRTFIRFRERLLSECRKFVVDILIRKPSAMCLGNEDSCKRELERLGIHLSHATLLTPCRIIPFPLECALKAGEKFERTNACTECKRLFADHIRTFRAETWEALPGYLGLESWEKLLATSARDAAALEEMMDAD